jgi:hypothetical protein
MISVRVEAARITFSSSYFFSNAIFLTKSVHLSGTIEYIVKFPSNNSNIVLNEDDEEST